MVEVEQRVVRLRIERLRRAVQRDQRLIEIRGDPDLRGKRLRV
jgi:hypothetical protein